jgi:hypothetical protein
MNGRNGKPQSDPCCTVTVFAPPVLQIVKTTTAVSETYHLGFGKEDTLREDRQYEDLR